MSAPAFQSKTDKGIVFLTCPKILDASVNDALKQAITQWLLSPEKHYVLDLAGVLRIDRETFPTWMSFSKSLKKNEKTLHSIGASPQLIAEFKTLGIDGLFSPLKDLSEVQAKLGQRASAAQDLNTKILSAIIEATRKVLEHFLNTKVAFGAPTITQNSFHQPLFIAGILQIKGTGLDGYLAISFTEPTFLAFLSAMYGEPVPAITSENQDAAAESLNMIYGAAKTDLSQKLDLKLEMAIPRVLKTSDLQPADTSRGPSLVVPIKWDTNEMRLELSARWSKS